jgi:hypothetical protein
VLLDNVISVFWSPLPEQKTISGAQDSNTRSRNVTFPLSNFRSPVDRSSAETSLRPPMILNTSRNVPLVRTASLFLLSSVKNRHGRGARPPFSLLTDSRGAHDGKADIANISCQTQLGLTAICTIQYCIGPISTASQARLVPESRHSETWQCGCSGTIFQPANRPFADLSV